MGSLKPGAAYVYEKDSGRIYAREYGSSERFLVGYDTDTFRKSNDRNFSLWNDILIEAEQNPALHQAVEKVIMLYRLIKDNPL